MSDMIEPDTTMTVSIPSESETITKKEKIEPEKVQEVIVQLDIPEDLAYVGEEARVYVHVENRTKQAIRGAKIEVEFSELLNVSDNVLSFGFLAPNDVVDRYWTIKPRASGKFTLYKPVFTYKGGDGEEHKQELESLRVEVKEAPKERQKRAKVTKRSRKALFSPWCPECNKYKGRQAECPHCGFKEE